MVTLLASFGLAYYIVKLFASAASKWSVLPNLFTSTAMFYFYMIPSPLYQALAWRTTNGSVSTLHLQVKLVFNKR